MRGFSGDIGAKVSYRSFLYVLLLVCALSVIYAGYKTDSYGGLELVSTQKQYRKQFLYVDVDKPNSHSVPHVKVTTKPSASTAQVLPQLPPKNILLWDSVSWFSLNAAGDSEVCGTCHITRNRAKISDPNTGAVLMHWPMHPRDAPTSNPKRAGQLYVWWSMEGPSLSKGSDPGRFKLYPNGFFNATLSYRRDSTFYNPVWSWFANVSIANMVKTRYQGIENDLNKLLQRKSKVAAWLVSNCNWGSNTRRRITYSQELIDNGLKLERFGKCFPKAGITPKRNTPEFFRFIERYKFYMSFENAIHCTDYITEKFEINALAAGVVPVVMGALKREYEAIAPPHSFIHVDDFPTAKKLVEYLDYLDKNDTAYAEYLAWRTMDPYDLFPNGRHLGFCQLCRTMYGVSPDDRRPFGEIYNTRNASYPGNKPIRPYRFESIYDWWIGSQPQECVG